MKILFLTFHGFDEFNGISKKIISQIGALKANGHYVDSCYYMVDKDNHRKRIINDTTLEDFGKGFIAQIKRRICYKILFNYIILNNIELIYVRSELNANPFLVNFFRRLKQNNIKIAIEIPTYPYDKEFKNKDFKTLIEHYIDILYRNKLVKQTNAVVTFTSHSSIFGGKTINISNGICFSSIKLKQRLNDTTKSLRLIGVANIHFWHGFDRLIKGISMYYKSEQKYKVYFYIVGGIGHIEELEFKKLIELNNLNDYIFLKGHKFGNELDEVFNECDLGIGSLARHRSNIFEIKTLKNREYAARGIPFIYSEIDNDFDTMPYVLKIPADESPIDINSLIAFYKNCDLDPMSIRETCKNLSWNVQMDKVIKCLNNQYEKNPIYK